MYTIIGIDHGNGNMKTAHCVFPCGYVSQKNEPSSLFTDEILKYDGRYYMLDASSQAYRVDKYNSEDCYILTLFAIAKELVERAREENREFTGFVGKEIVLAVGLPPAHFEEKWKAFKRYFESHAKHGIDFTFNNRHFSFHVKDVHVYPQNWAAVTTFMPELIRQYSTVYCIDVGDGTVDMVGLVEKKPDKKLMVSIEGGGSHLRSRIKNDVIKNYSITLNDRSVTDVLTKRPTVLDEDIKSFIEEVADEFTTNLLNELHVLVPDFRIAPTVLCGGGALLLKDRLERSGQFKDMEYIKDIKANAIGYEKIAKTVLMREESKV